MINLTTCVSLKCTESPDLHEETPGKCYHEPAR